MITLIRAQQVIPPDPRQLASHVRCAVSITLALIVARAGEFQR
jgi:hypothetical protein